MTQLLQVCKNHIINFPVNLESIPQLPPLSKSHTNPIILLPYCLRPGTRQLETHPSRAEGTNIMKTSQFRLFRPSLPCLSHREHNQGSRPCFPLLPACIGWCLPMCLSFLGNCNKKLFFSDMELSVLLLNHLYKLRLVHKLPKHK